MDVLYRKKSLYKDDYMFLQIMCVSMQIFLDGSQTYVNHSCYIFINTQQIVNLFHSLQLVIAFSDIVSIEKRMTAYVIPNAIQISTLHAKVSYN